MHPVLSLNQTTPVAKPAASAEERCKTNLPPSDANVDADGNASAEFGALFEELETPKDQEVVPQEEAKTSDQKLDSDDDGVPIKSEHDSLMAEFEQYLPASEDDEQTTVAAMKSANSKQKSEIGGRGVEEARFSSGEKPEPAVASMPPKDGGKEKVHGPASKYSLIENTVKQNMSAPAADNRNINGVNFDTLTGRTGKTVQLDPAGDDKLVDPKTAKTDNIPDQVLPKAAVENRVGTGHANAFGLSQQKIGSIISRAASVHSGRESATSPSIRRTTDTPASDQGIVMPPTSNSPEVRNFPQPIVSAVPDISIAPRASAEAFSQDSVAFSAEPFMETGRSAAAPGQALLNRPDLPAHIARQMAEVMQQLPNRPVELALNPVELGRVRMSIKSDEAGIVVHVLAERAETLDLLKRNIGQLAQDFQSLGYESISFTFGEGAPENRNENTEAGDGPGISLDLTDTPEERPVSDNTGANRGVDIRL